MTKPADTGVSEELVEWAQRKYLNAPGSGAEAMRLVLEAIAPRLRVEGMRDARAIMLGAMTITEQLRRIDEAIAALSPQEPKP